MADRIPSLNWLRVFEAAARAGSFARAAELLAMSPPAVSQQIRALEGHLGRELFERQAAGVRLTEAGRGLLVVVSESLGRMEAAASALSAPSRSVLVVGVSLAFSIGWLSPRLPHFLQEHPEIRLELHSLIGRSEAPPRHATLWVSFGPPPPGTDATVLFGERLIPVAHPQLASRIRNLDDLRGVTIIEVADHRQNWAQILGSDVVPSSMNILYVDTTLAALSLAASGAGVALARPPATGDLPSRFGLQPCLDDCELPGIEFYHVLHAKDASLSVAARAFKSWLCDEAKSFRQG